MPNMNMMMVMMNPSSLLPKLTTRLVSPQIVQTWEPPPTTQRLKPTFHMFILRPVTRHMSAEITAFGVEPLMTDRTVHAITAIV